MSEKSTIIAFINEKLKSSFEELNEGKFEDRELYKWISKAIEELVVNPEKGIKIAKKLWPKEYIQEYQITNLWKYNLPSAWRLMYTIEANDIKIMGIILEWLDHKEYERRFGY